ncbi:MAG TPA: glycosyltransferase family 39 protein [Candidatus Acidoferrales bacterium]|nr:glycosyltransferase family 39 protein [Candidatus Acidoferrales bacterium]
MSRGAWWAAAIVAVVVAFVHLVSAGRYGIFVNELYFIVCGRHPAFGYVDQPPFVPLLAALTQLGGVDLWLMRLPGILAAVALVPLTVALAQLIGASTRGAWLAAVAYASATLVTALSATLGTSTFEPLEFTAVAYFVTRAIVRNEPRSYWWAGLVGGLAFETRYGILWWVAGLAIGVAVCGPRSIFRSRDLWIGIGIAAVIALPNAVWQAVHGFPFVELVRNDNSGNFIGSPLGFTLGQFFLINMVVALLCIVGVVAPFVMSRLAPFRFLAVAFVVALVLIYVTHGKAYYTAGVYPSIIALGAAAVTNVPRALVGLWAVLAAANAALALPWVLPVLPVERFAAMLARSSFKPPAMERAGIGAPLMQVYSTEFGWRELAQIVESVYASLPASDRAKAAIYAPTYGDASAINVYGRNLPFAISGNNQYYLWGPGDHDGSVVIAVNADPRFWSGICASARVVGYTEDSPYAMPYEVHQPIVLCRGMHPPLPQLWPTFKHYGVESPGVGAPKWFSGR